jgi:hypothetical protein
VIDAETVDFYRAKTLEGARGLRDSLDLCRRQADAARKRAARLRDEAEEADRVAARIDEDVAFLEAMIAEREKGDAS